MGSGAIQITEDGRCVPNLSTSDFIWLPKEIIGDYDIPRIDVDCHVSEPLDDSALVKFVRLLKGCLAHNFVSGLLVACGMVMSFHYKTIQEIYGGCSITIALGPAETGKSTAIRMALSLLGLLDSNHYVRGTNTLFLARSTACCLPYAIDDPKGKGKAKTNQLDVGELIVDLYNGNSSANLKTGIQRPASCPIIASNFMINEAPR